MFPEGQVLRHDGREETGGGVIHMALAQTALNGTQVFPRGRSPQASVQREADEFMIREDTTAPETGVIKPPYRCSATWDVEQNRKGGKKWKNCHFFSV